jgi:putative ABC transport system permease protein
MPILSRLSSTFRTLFRKGRIEQDLDDELQGFLEQREQELIASGQSPERARRMARLEVGGVEQVKERVRDERRGSFVDTLHQDVRFGGRQLLRNVAFTAVTVATLAIAIGGTTAVLSTVDMALFRPVAYPEPDRLVGGLKTVNGADRGPVSRLDYFDFRGRSRSFDGLGAWGGVRSVAVLGGSKPWVADAGIVTWNLFRILRVDPVLGRHFLPEEEAEAKPTTVIISHGAWQTHFGGSSRVIGSSFTAFGRQVTIVGVMPAGFRFLADADMWTLVNREGPWDPVRDSHSHLVFGRLKPGVSVEQAQQDVNAIAHALELEYPATNKGKGLRITPLQAFMVRDLRIVLMLLTGAVLAVLLIAGTNVAGLLLARGLRRMPEMAMRSALGASRWRLVRQLLTESVLLTGIAGVLGLVVTQASLGALGRLLGIMGIERPPLDGRMLLVTLVLSVVTGLLIGVIPALRATAVGPARWIGTGRQQAEGRHSIRLRAAFVVAQVALSVVLLAGSAHLIRNIVGLTPHDIGFNPEGVYTARVMLASPRYGESATRKAFLDAVLSDISALPGVVSAAAVSKVPIRDQGQKWGIWPVNEPPASSEEGYFAMARWVTPGYFEAMGIPVVAGRDISARDIIGAPQVIVISGMVARRLFPGRDPIGQTVHVWSTSGTFEVVGVVGDARLTNMVDDPDPAMYMSADQAGNPTSRIVVRTSGNPESLAAPIRGIVRAQDRTVPVVGLMPMTAVVDEGMVLYRIVNLSMGFYAGTALLLTAIGLFGAMAYHVSQQEGEMGVRLAVGASPTSLLGRVVLQGMALSGLGLVLGAIASIPSFRLLVFEHGPTTMQAHVASSLAAGVIALSLVMLVACLVPAWRVLRINPVDVLRKE